MSSYYSGSQFYIIFIRLTQNIAFKRIKFCMKARSLPRDYFCDLFNHVILLHMVLLKVTVKYFLTIFYNIDLLGGNNNISLAQYFAIFLEFINYNNTIKYNTRFEKTTVTFCCNKLTIYYNLLSHPTNVFVCQELHIILLKYFVDFL